MPTTDRDTDPNTHQGPTTVAPDGHLEVPASVARQGTRGSKRTMWVLSVSLVAAVAALGLYWASQARGLHNADKQPGEVAASGRMVTDPKVVEGFHAPEPQPKQPSADQVAASSTPAPTSAVPTQGQ